MQRRDFVKTGIAAGGTALGAPAIEKLLDSSPDKGTFVHCVYFWLKESLTEREHRSFRKGLDSLTAIESVRQGFYGAPAETDRPIIDRSYTYGLVIVCDDREAHDAYQVDEIHDAFREKFGEYWEEVKIYDFVVG